MKRIVLILVCALTLGTTTASAQFINDTRTKKPKMERRYQGEVEVSYDNNFDIGCIGLGTDHGIRFNENIYLGLGVRANMYPLGDVRWFVTVPYLSFKAYLPLSEKVSLFVNPTVGFELGLSGSYYDTYSPHNTQDIQPDLDMYVDYSLTVGAQFSHFYVGAGVGSMMKRERTKGEDMYVPCLRVKLGYTF